MLDARVDVPLVVVGTVGVLGTQIADLLARPSLRAQRDFIGQPLPYGTTYRDGLFGQVTFAPSRPWRNFSDIALVAAPALALFAPSPGAFRQGGMLREGGKKLVVYEALAITLTLTSAGKNAWQRPRPYALYEPSDAWIGEEQVFQSDLHESCTDEVGCTFRDRDVFWSFPSGHTSIVTAAGVAWTTTEILTAPGKRRWRWLALAAPMGLGGLVGYARVRAGKHRPSDVVGGWLLGTTVGLVVPLVHDRGLRVGAGPGDVGLSVGGAL